MQAGTLRPKLCVSAPEDNTEREADRIAAAVTRQPEPAVQRQCTCGGSCPKCAEENVLRLQRVAADGNAPDSAPGIVHEALRGAGEPLAPTARCFMEPRFNYDFSRVRVHTDRLAAQSARTVNALAYTVGSHLVFGAGQYRPDTFAGRKLLAHELAHVVQQQGAPGFLQRQREQPAGGDEEINPTEASEEAGPPIPAPTFGTHPAEPECPRPPTGLGFVTPEPPCPTSTEEIGGALFFFCLDSDVMRGHSALDIATLARNSPANSIFKVHGFASFEGADDYNMNLSCHRAKRVARELINAGVRSERIQIAAQGRTRAFDRLGRTSQERLAANRVVVVDAQSPAAPAAPTARHGLSDRGRLVEQAINRIETGGYRLAADAYVSLWTCGEIPSVIEMVRRTRILVEGDAGIEGVPGRSTSQLGLPVRRPFPQTDISQIILSAEAFESFDPLECVTARMVDMAFHRFVSARVPPNRVHAAALFLVELAGILPCRNSFPNLSDPTRSLPGDLWWPRPTQDPLAGLPEPDCAPGRLPGAIGTGRVARGPHMTAVPQFTAQPIDFAVGSGPLRWQIRIQPRPFTFTPAGGQPRQGVFRQQMATAENAHRAFEATGSVTATGDPAEIANYRVGFLQTVLEDEAVIDYVSGHRVHQSVPVPIRDGVPRSVTQVPHDPPWYDIRGVATPDPATGLAEARLADSPDLVMMYEFENQPNNVINRARRHTRFNTWLVARRMDAPLDPFSTRFLRGLSWEITQEVDVVGREGTGTFESRVVNAPPGSESTMQLAGPVPGDVPREFRISFTEPVPRNQAGGLPLEMLGRSLPPNVTTYQQRVRELAEPIRREMGLSMQMLAQITINVATGRVALETQSLMPVQASAEDVPNDVLQNFAERLFDVLRKDLVLAPITGGRPGSESLSRIPVVLRVIPNTPPQHFTRLIDRPGMRDLMRRMWSASRTDPLNPREFFLTVVANRRTGALVVSSRQGEAEELQQPMQVPACQVDRPVTHEDSILGTIHTHPNTSADGVQEPSPEDRSRVADNPEICGLEHYVISDGFVFRYTKDGFVRVGRRRQLLGE